MRPLLPLLLLAACIGSSEPVDSEDSQAPVTYETCDELEPAFQAETESIRSCDAPEDCGQQLTGTSCGCTRDWVARADADTTLFYDLIQQGSALQCDLPLASTCDCPQADGFDCVDGTCTWNYVP